MRVIWTRCAARLVNDYTRNGVHKYFTTQVALRRTGSSRCAQLFIMTHDLTMEDQDPDDLATFINTDVKTVFQEMYRQTSFDTLTDKDTYKVVR